MVDINKIINMEIQKAEIKGRYELAAELLEIASKGKNIPEWMESRDRVIEKLLDVKDECSRFMQNA